MEHTERHKIPKLAKRRDELANESRADIKRLRNMLGEEWTSEHIANYSVHDFKRGFNACHTEMLPMLEQMAAALEHYESAHYDLSGNACNHDDVARAALAAYHAWRGEGES